MRGAMLGLAMLLGGAAWAQTIRLGEVERWYLALGPLIEARSCIGADDPLRPGLEAMLRDVQGRAQRDIHSDYEKGILAGRLAAHGAAVPASGDDAHCDRVMAHVARGLIRIHAH
jgi:hypothetical protein